MFDVAFADAGKSYQLQNQISDLFHNKLMDGMEQLFNRLVPDDTLLTLGDVELDIGSVSYNFLEYDLVNRILEELEREINYRLALIPSNSTGDNNEQQLKKVESSYTSLLEYFLLTAAMPWWAAGETLNDPLAIMEHLIAKDAAILKQLIINIGQHTYVRQRLVQQFSEQVIRDIVTILEPGQAEFIFTYHALVVQNHRKEKLIKGAINTEFDKALWLFILTYILVDRGSIFNQKFFVRSTLGQMASHYNLAYAQILALLSKALAHYNLTDVQNNNLALIINELSVDEFDDNQQPLSMASGGGSAAEIVQQKVELLRHFLVFGSLPWWSEPYSESNIVNMLLDLIRTVPKAVSKLITTTGKNESVRERITNLFDDEVIIEIVKLLEPANAGFIISYVAEVEVIHTKKPVVYSDSKDFKKAVWKFIFDFLLVERGSVFNERMFLESNIRKLANTYNVQYADMLVYLVQSVGQVHQASIEHAPLFQLLAGLLNDLNQQAPVIIASKNNAVSNTYTETIRTVVLKDVLLHWLIYGSIPWWGSKYFEQGPATMFQNLFTTAPYDAFLLLKYAGTIPNIRKRVIYQIPQQLVISMLSKQPGGETAVRLYQYLLQAFNRQGKGNNLQPISNMVLLVFWDVYIAGNYKKFDSVSFIQKSIYAFVKQQGITQKNSDSTIAYEDIIAELRSILNTANEATYLVNPDGFKALEHADIDLVLYGSDVKDIDLRQSLIHYLETKTPGRQAVINEALLILKYFLDNNRLPQQFKGTYPAYVKSVVEQLLQLLKKSDSKAYKQLVSGNKQLKTFVKEETDTASLIEGSIEQLISSYLQQDYQPQKKNILNEALNILRHFLSTGKLPEPFANANVWQILKQLLLLLNYEDAAALKNILQRDNYLIDSRIILHNLFTTTANTAESNVSHVLKEYLEKDIARYIVQQPGFAFNNDEPIAVILDSYIKQSEGKLHSIIPLLKNQAVAKYISRHYTDVQVTALLNHNATMIGGSENLAWLNDLQLLITHNVTYTLQRDRLFALLREFNLLVLGRHISVNSFTAYLKQLLNFIISAGHSNFTALSGAILRAGTTPGLSPLFAAKLAAVLTEISGYNNDQTIAQRIKQQLNRNDDNALQNATGISQDKKGIEIKQLKEEIKQNLHLAEEIMKDENKKLLVNSKDTIYINNAGLVLLNPFLSTYFVRLDMMTGGKFNDADAQLRAVHLLQYLVNGKSNNPEHFLVLNKVFCNVPVEEPVPAEITLNDKEIEISEQLLKAVLNSWDKLKNTSIVGLQESFLQRDGALVFKDDAWHLTVEQRGYDILLQTLPWTIGMVKTPWMDNFLYTEWI